MGLWLKRELPLLLFRWEKPEKDTGLLLSVPLQEMLHSELSFLEVIQVLVLWEAALPKSVRVNFGILTAPVEGPELLPVLRFRGKPPALAVALQFMLPIQQPWLSRI